MSGKLCVCVCVCIVDEKVESIRIKSKVGEVELMRSCIIID